MTRHLKMDEPDEANLLDRMAQGVLGTAMDRPEGALKVSGQALYAAEHRPENMARGVLVRATVARGRVVAVDEEAVRALPGVIAVIRDPRMLRNPAQGTANAAPVQGVEEVFYVGQPIALVVAETFEEARHGALSLRVEYERLPSTVDPESTLPEAPEAKQQDKGDFDAAFASAALRIDDTWHTSPVVSGAMEPHAAVAEWHDDTLVLHGSYQMLNYNRNELADALGIPADKVRMLAPYVGGGFGSKLGISHEAVAAAIAARELGRPVGVTLSRQQVFEATSRRSSTRQRIRLAADAEGHLTGIAHEYLVENLPDESFSEPVSQATRFMYGAENRRVVHHIARVNRTCAGSVRAPGEAVGVPTVENAMDELAEAAGIDPVELRLRNIPDVDPSSGKPFSANLLAKSLREGASRFGWDQRNATPGTRQDGEWLIGMGMASAARVNILADAEARVRLSRDGTAIVETDMTDIGTGTYAVLTQIVCEMLGLPPERVTVRLGDTNYPPGPGSGGSWGASSSGSAAYLACQDIRQTLCARLGCTDDAMTLKDGFVITGNRRIPLTEVLNGDTLTATGKLEPGKTSKNWRQATFGAHFAEVAVSEATGETRVRRMTGVYAAGRILNAKTARSQCIGGLTFGIGLALTEELAHDRRDGHIVNRDFANYHIPCNLDVPPMDIHFLEERDPYASPMQSKGIGELSICGSAGAVINAIYNACGVRVRDYPATPDKVLAGLH